MSQGRALKHPFNGDQRKQDGVTITFVETTTGELATVSQRGLPMVECVKYLCEDADAWEGEWKVLCVSTPTTIWRDLQGIREQRGWQGDNYEAPPAGPTGSPEVVALSRAGRMDLYIEPNNELQEYRGDRVRAPSFQGELSEKIERLRHHW